MTKGVAVQVKNYGETIPRVLSLIKLDSELKKHDRIVLKPNIFTEEESSTNMAFLESVLRYCISHKNPGAEIFIAEGTNGEDTEDLFHSRGYTKLSEKYGVGLIDLNHSETEEIHNSDFLGFESIKYPKILKDSFVISLPKLSSSEKVQFIGSLYTMTGAFPAKHYKGLFSSSKSKLNKIPLKYQVHDILKCKVPDLAILDASDKGMVIIGQAIEMDKQAAKVLGLDWKNISYMRLIDESFSQKSKNEGIDNIVG